MKENREFYFTVEGETEKLYLEWLQQVINHCEDSLYRVVLKCKVLKDPTKVVKNIAPPAGRKIIIHHLFDYEGEQHDHEFRQTLALAKKVGTLKRDISCKIGYSNLTFESWLLLHKQANVRTVIRQTEYLQDINRVFSQAFESLSSYKKRDNFAKILNKLTLDDVKTAIANAKRLVERLQRDNETLYRHSGYEYYKRNPSFSVHERIEYVLKECGLM